jgi:hypothetical protein
MSSCRQAGQTWNAWRRKKEAGRRLSPRKYPSSRRRTTFHQTQEPDADILAEQPREPDAVPGGEAAREREGRLACLEGQVQPEGDLDHVLSPFFFLALR